MDHPQLCPAGHGPAAMDLPLKLLIARLANGVSPASLAQAQADWLMHLLVSPAKQADLAASAWRKWAEWWIAAPYRQRGMETDGSVAMLDKRFAREEWRQYPFDLIARGFLLS